MKDFSFLEPAMKAFMEKVSASGAPPIYKLPVEEAREVLNSLQSQPVNKAPVHVEETEIPTEKGRISLRIYKGPSRKNKLPVLMYFHGGGWILGNKETHDRLVRDLAYLADIAVVFVNYTPSPEAQFPVAIEEAYAATRYVASHPDEFHVDATRLAVAGDSVGGNMAIAVTLLAKERGGPRISQQILFYPVCDANFNTPSYKEYASGPWLTKPAMKWFWDAYLPDPKERKNPLASPLHAPIPQLRGLPPALLLTAEHDVLRDEGEAYAHKLYEANVPTTAIRFLGAIHDFLLINPVSHSPLVQTALSLAVSKLKQLN